MASKCTIDLIKEFLSELESQLNDIKQSKKKTAAGLQSELDATIQPKKANVDDNNEEKRPSSSWWGWIRVRVRKGFKVKKETSSDASDSGEGSQGGSRKRQRNLGQDQADANLEILKLQKDIRQMMAAFENLAHFQSNISKSLETEVPSNKLRAILSKTDSVKSRARDLKEIRRKVLNLKGQIPSLLKKQSSIGLSISDSQTAEENGQIVETGSDMFLPGLHVSDDFKHSSAFEEVVDKFKVLEIEKKLCLLSLAVFPENKEVKSTMLMYWWIGEGFISYEDSEEAEDTVTRILTEFSEKGLVEPVEDERKLKPSGYKMEPHVQAAVIYLARRMELFDLYSAGKLKMQHSKKENVCLVKRSSLQQEAKASKMPLKTLNSVFNSSERYPDFTFKWFPGMEALKVLYLGRWERTAKRHIEVESTEFLKDIKSLRSLRLASFQGISRIENLKELTCSLPKLVILDLRACYNLEGLPENIGSLESLIYLDVSECYMLDRMPGGISRLETLQVLKGFVISQSDDEKDCAVKELVNLRKLSITVNRYPFNVEDFVASLKQLKKLESLKIAWGAQFPDEENVKGGGNMDQVHKKGQTSEENGDEKANLEEGKKCHEVNAKSFKSDKGNAEQDEGKKRDKVDAEKSRSEDGVEGVKKGSPSSESTNTVENKKTDDKQEEKRDEKKDKFNQEEGKKQNEMISSKPDKVTEGDKKTSPLKESKDTVKSKQDDPQTGDKQEEKRDEEKDKIEEDNKKDEVKAVSSKPDEVDKKTSSAQQSKDTIQSKPDDHKENSKVQEKGDGEKIKAALKKPDEGEAKTQKLDKNKLRKKVSFSEEPRASVQKKPDDMKKGNHEMASTSRSKTTATKKLFTMMRTETKKLVKGSQEDSRIDTSKLPSSLRKLELECYPEKEPPVWLNPKTLVSLEKLSIKGGNLSRFSEETEENKCSVQILRLKYLHEFKAKWKDLHELFPQLKLLEKYKCPQVAFCPTDGNGVWRSQP